MLLTAQIDGSPNATPIPIKIRISRNMTSQDPGFDHDHLLQFDIGFLEGRACNPPRKTRSTAKRMGEPVTRNRTTNS